MIVERFCPNCKIEMIYREKEGTIRCKKCNYAETVWEVSFEKMINSYVKNLCDKLITLANFTGKALPLIKKWIPKIGYQSAEPQTIASTLIMLANEKLNLTDPEKLFEDLRIWIDWYYPTYEKWKEKLEPLIRNEKKKSTKNRK